jgi:hypothetical protein
MYTLVKKHAHQLNSQILRHGYTLVEEVCEALLDMDPKEFILSAIPEVLPGLVIDREHDTLASVSLLTSPTDSHDTNMMIMKNGT